MALPSLSIIICTHNRPKLLLHCLNLITKQIVSLRNCEVIVVDNYPHTHVKKLVETFRNQYPLNPLIPLTYRHEKKLGLAYARNVGARAARGRYLAYIDDDAYPAPNWIRLILATIKRVKPDVYGGAIYPYYHSPKPAWFLDKYEIRSHGRQARFLKPNEYLSGGNFIVRKRVLATLGYFPTSLGMAGKNLGYGEETKLLVTLRAKVNKPKIFYNPRLMVYHLVPPHKMTLAYRLRSCFVSGRYALPVFGHASRKRRLWPLLAKLFGKTLLSLFNRNKNRYPYWQNYFWEEVMPYCYELGTLWPKR